MNELIVTTYNEDLAVSVADVKQHCHIDASFDDAYIEDMILRATRYCEGICHKFLQETECRLMVECWDTKLYFHSAPLVSVDTAYYLDYNGDEQEWSTSDYEVVKGSRPYIYSLKSPPIHDNKQRPIYIDCVMGYSVLPLQAKQAILQLCLHWYDNRNGVLVGSISKNLEHTIEDCLRQIAYNEV